MSERKLFPLMGFEGEQLSHFEPYYNYYNLEAKFLGAMEDGVLAEEIYDARRELEQMYPSLDFRVVRSGRRYRHYVVGVRPKEAVDEIHVWMWTPMDGFPDDELRTKLMLVDNPVR